MKKIYLFVLTLLFCLNVGAVVVITEDYVLNGYLKINELTASQPVVSDSDKKLSSTSFNDFSENIDHGLLLGLSDDDHTQYHTDARALTWLGTRSTSDLPEGSNLYFTNERAQDAVGAMVGPSLVYVDGTPLLARAALTGDVTAPQDSNSTTIANDAVTYAKMQNVSATSRVLGRISSGAGDVEELTGANIATIANASFDHGALTGLSDDDHTQYALLAGRSGGQNLKGGTGSGDNLTLNSTNHGTKGKIYLGANSVYDELNDRLGLKTTSPGDVALDVNGSALVRSDLQIGVGSGFGGFFTIKGNEVEEMVTVNPINNTVLLGEDVEFRSRGPIYFNETNGDYDSQIRGVDDNFTFYVDASESRVGFGAGSPEGKVDILGFTDEVQLVIHAASTQTANLVEFRVLPTEAVQTSFSGTGGAVFNEQGNDADFRVEGDTNVNLIFADASTDRVGIGTSSPAQMLDISSTAPSFQMTDTTASAKSLRLVTDGNKSSFYEAAGAAGQILTLDLTNNWIGVGTDTPGTGSFVSGTQKAMLHVKNDGDYNTLMGVSNTDASGTSALAGLRTQASTAVINFQSHGAGRTATRFGVTLASYNELLGVTGNGFLFGTFNSAPVIIGTNSISAIQIDTSQNVIIGATAAGTSAAKVVAIANGTAPASSPADMVQLWAQDTVAGQSNLYARNENGKSVQLTGLADRLSSQFDKANTTLADITGLTHNVEAGKAYAFEAVLYTSSNVASGIKAAISGTATATSIIYESLVLQTGTTVASTASRSTALAGTVCNVTAVTVATCIIKGTIVVNAAGTLLPQFADNAGTNTSSVLVGSTWKLTPIGD